MSLDPHNLSIVFFRLRLGCFFICMPSITSYVCNMYMCIPSVVVVCIFMVGVVMIRTDICFVRAW